MPPVGFERRLRIFIDPDLHQNDEVLAAAGTWIDTFLVAPDDVVRAGGAVVTDPTRCRVYFVREPSRGEPSAGVEGGDRTSTLRLPPR